MGVSGGNAGYGYCWSVDREKMVAETCEREKTASRRVVVKEHAMARREWNRQWLDTSWAPAAPGCHKWSGESY
jgi:hypothetical protein